MVGERYKYWVKWCKHFNPPSGPMRHGPFYSHILHFMIYSWRILTLRCIDCIHNIWLGTVQKSLWGGGWLRCCTTQMCAPCPPPLELSQIWMHPIKVIHTPQSWFLSGPWYCWIWEEWILKRKVLLPLGQGILSSCLSVHLAIILNDGQKVYPPTTLYMSNYWYRSTDLMGLKRAHQHFCNSTFFGEK